MKSFKMIKAASQSLAVCKKNCASEFRTDFWGVVLIKGLATPLFKTKTHILAQGGTRIILCVCVCVLPCIVTKLFDYNIRIC